MCWASVKSRVQRVFRKEAAPKKAAAILFAWYREGPSPAGTDHWYATDALTGISVTQIANTCPYPVSYLDVDWWKTELRNIRTAGFDIAAVQTYPGAASTVKGFPVLARAWQELKDAGEDPVPLGIFFEVNWLSGADLTDPAQREAAWAKFNASLCVLPREAWADAMATGVPFLGYYVPSGVVKRWDRTFFDDLRARLWKTYSVKPYIVVERQWDTPAAPLGSAVNALYAWSTHADGPVDLTRGRGGGTVNLFVGYERHPYQPWHAFDYRRLREDGISGPANPTGTWYDWCWQKVIAQKVRVVLCQWNELAEDITLCHTNRFGTRYMEDSAAWIGAWKEGKSLKPPVRLLHPQRVREFPTEDAPPEGKGQATMELDAAGASYGWWSIESGGGLRTFRGITDARVALVKGELVNDPRYSPDYMVFDWVATGWAYDVPFGAPFRVSVTLTDKPDSAGARIALQYDAHANAYKTADFAVVTVDGVSTTVPAADVEMQGDGKQKTLEWILTDARFQRQQNGAANFRLAVSNNRRIYVNRVAVTDMSRLNKP